MIAPAPVVNTLDDPDDRLFRLLPPALQISDAFAGQALRALLRIIGEQGRLVDDDISRLMDNWFVETCDDWALPYIGELVGYRLVPELTRALMAGRLRGQAHAIVPRREVANTVRFRRRKGSLLLLEEIAHTATGWPARAVEVRTLVASAPHVRFLELERRAFADARAGDILDFGFGPFSALSRLPDARRLVSRHATGRGSVNSIALYVWRLRPFLVRYGRACHRCPDQIPQNGGAVFRFSFDPFGEERSLFHAPGTTAPHPTGPAVELDVPGPIRRRAFRAHTGSYYGPAGSLNVWVGTGSATPVPVSLPNIVPANLTHWEQSLLHPLKAGAVAVDPVLGRLLVYQKKRGVTPEVWVRYHTGFSADIGGGTRRTLLAVPKTQTWTVRKTNLNPDDPEPDYRELSAALDAWDDPDRPRPRRVVIEVQDDANYDLGETSSVPETVPTRLTKLEADEYLEIRASAGRRPVVILRRETCETERCWRIESDSNNAAFVLDGLVLGGPTSKDRLTTDAEVHQTTTFMGLELRLNGRFAKAQLRHVTLTPGRSRIVLERFKGCIDVERSILGPILTTESTRGEPPKLFITDSIVDGVGHSAIGSLSHTPDQKGTAFLALTAQRVTVLGTVQVYSVVLGQDSIFEDKLLARRQDVGCVRFCYFAQDSKTPPRYRCHEGNWPLAHRNHADSAYAQLAPRCPIDVSQGAEDGSELGALHDLYQPEREALLRSRLAEFTLADSDAQLFFAT